MQLRDIFNSSLIGRAGETAVEYDDGGTVKTLTFGELDSRSNQLANLFAERGIERGDRICFFLANSIEIIDVFLASIKSGVILVPVNVLYRERELSHIISDATPKAVITTAENASMIPAETVVWTIEELSEKAVNFSNSFAQISIDGDEAAAIVYTSGTTGRSKGAILTHHNFAVNAVNLLACWQISSADRYLAVLPLFHVHGLGNGVVCWLASGCLMRLVEKFDIKKAVSIFENFQPTLFFGVPTIYVRLLELAETNANKIGAAVRLFVCGSAPLPAQILEDFETKFGHRILERYGMSETLMNISNPYFGERRAGTVGFPLPGVSTKIVDAELNEVKTNEIGELLVRGGNVCNGYWQLPTATAEAFADGWFRTGDIAQQSPDGYITLCGRRSELIISGGFNIYPREIEEVLLEQKSIREVVVCGTPDAKRGELPLAYIVADDDFNEQETEKACRLALASFKIPRAFIKVESLPRTALGKVQKHLLPPWKANDK